MSSEIKDWILENEAELMKNFIASHQDAFYEFCEQEYAIFRTMEENKEDYIPDEVIENE